MAQVNLNISDDEMLSALEQCNGNKTQAAKMLGVSRSVVRTWCQNQGFSKDSPKRPLNTAWSETRQRDTWVIESNDTRICTVDDCLKKAGVNLDIWEVAKVVIGGSDVTMKLRRDTGVDEPFRGQNQNIKVYLRRKVPESVEKAVDRLIDKLRKHAPVVPKIKRVKFTKKDTGRRVLEICPMDLHYGLRCFKPGSDAEWNPEICVSIVMDTIEEILALAKPFMPFEKIIVPIGNDLFHADSIIQKTTKGTPQPEADAYFHTFIGGEQLGIWMVDRLKELADVEVYAIPGNHDRLTAFMLGRVLCGYYHNDKNVTIYADESPYKFWRFGVNLIGYEHGHSVRPAIRLAALMANECPEHWLATKHGYREWHLGDQHRKASSKPATFEEMGVSVEYLPAPVPAEEWHKLNGYNWQQRGTMAFVWHHDHGPIARLQVNIDKYRNGLMGRGGGS